MPTRVMVLSTLHQYHGQVACYGFDALERILTALAPDLLFCEVTEDDLRLRGDEKVKQEYPKVVYPLLAAHGWPALPLEPSGAVADDLVRRKREAESQLTGPQREAVTSFVLQWAQDLFAGWSSPADVNSARTDASARAKNERTLPEYPPDYARGWDAWNQHFLDRIVAGIEELRPRLALVLVGLEHSYWLRPRLAADPRVALLDAEAVLRQMPCGARESGA